MRRQDEKGKTELAIRRAYQKAYQKGADDKIHETAKEMIKDKENVEKIMKYTKLDKATIEKIIKEMKIGKQ